MQGVSIFFLINENMIYYMQYFCPFSSGDVCTIQRVKYLFEVIPILEKSKTIITFITVMLF